MTEKPWVEGSTEVLELTIEQYYMSKLSKRRKESDRYLRLALINGDDAVELAAKACIEFDHAEKEKGNFYENLKWIRENVRFKNKNQFNQVEQVLRYYHKQRDTLYHASYSPPMSRLQVLGFIANCIYFFRTVFPIEIDLVLQNNTRRRFLTTFLELEKQIVDLCRNNGIEVEDDSSLSDLLFRMEKEKVINEEMRQTIEEVNTLHEKLIPTVEDVPYDISEVSLTLTDMINNLKGPTSRKTYKASLRAKLSMPKQIMKCPIEDCKGRFSSLDILANHIAMTKDASHKAWKRGNDILRESRRNVELKAEIKPVLESKMHYNRATKLYEFY
jgi:hypothetical protein